jgi:histone-binding protein RBBP4
MKDKTRNGSKNVQESKSLISYTSQKSFNNENIQMENSEMNSDRSELDSEEEKQGNLRIWQRNVPLFYKYLVSHVLEWQSLTCQYMPIFKENEQKEYINQKIIIGANKEDGQSYLYIANIKLPNPNTKNYNLSNFRICKKEESFLKTGMNAIELETKINHPGDIYKARVMYNSYNMISTKAQDGLIYIFDYSNHPFEPQNDEIKAKMVLEGLEKQGWGLDWQIEQPLVLSSDDDGNVCQWDLEHSPLSTNKNNKNGALCLQPLHKNNLKLGSVNEVKYHRFYQSLFGLVSSNYIAFFDTDRSFQKPVIQLKAHEKEVFTIDFSYDHEFLFVTGGEGGILKLWDLRKTDGCLSTLQSSGKNILRSEWSPTTEGVFITAGEDTTVDFWDCKKIQEGSEEKAKFFVHQGFSRTVNDICWNPCLPFSISAVDDNNELQIFQIDEDFYYK